MAQKKKEDPEKLSRELLRELTKDPSYKAFKDDEELSREIGASIQNARKKKKITTAELAKRINKSEKVVSRMERGEFKQYTVKLLQQIARELGSRLRIDLET